MDPVSSSISAVRSAIPSALKTSALPGLRSSIASPAVSTRALIPKKTGTPMPTIMISTTSSTSLPPWPPRLMIGAVAPGIAVPAEGVRASPYCTLGGGVGSGSKTGGVPGGKYCWNVGLTGVAAAAAGAARPRVIRSISPTVPAVLTSWIRFALSASTICPRAAAASICAMALSRSLSLGRCPQSATLRP